MGPHVKHNLQPISLPVVAVTFIIHILRSNSTAESRVAAQWTHTSSRDVDGMDLAQAASVSNKTKNRRSMLSTAVGLQILSRNEVPALFVFGDSTVDVGNNNHLETLAQATFWPYGMDFDTHLPTGRFCDGRLSVDFIADYLGLPLAPPFASGTYFEQGANFASAGSGVLPDTGSIFELVFLAPCVTSMPGDVAGRNTLLLKPSYPGLPRPVPPSLFPSVPPNLPYCLARPSSLIICSAQVGEHIRGEVIPFSEQLKNFQIVQQLLKAELGDLQASMIVSESIYYISTGSNDFINNYLLPNSPHWQLAATDFQQLLLANFTQQVRTLFKMGARKIVVVSLSPLGCLPSQLFKMGSKQGECIAPVNNLAVEYNALLADSLHGLRRHLPGAKITYNDAYLAFSHITENAAFYGIRHTNQSCCGMGMYGGMKACLIWTSVCQNASDHLFWDEFHPTTTTYKLIAESFWSGSLEVSSPWNVQTLASL